MKAYKGSFFVRLLSPAFTLLDFLRVAYNNSLIVSGTTVVEQSYALSHTKKISEAFCSAEDPANASGYKHFLQRIEKALHKIGEYLSNSWIYKSIEAAKQIYFRTTKQSLLFSYLNQVPLHRWFLILFALYLPLEYLIRDVVGFSLLSSLWEELFIGLAMIIILWRTMLKQSNSFSRANTIEVMIILFFAVGLLLMTLNRPFPSVALAGYRAQVEYMVWFLLILRLTEDKADAKALCYAFAGTVFVLCLHGIYQYIIGVEIPDSWTSNTEMGVRTRVFSITGSPNIFGSLIVMAAPTMAALVYSCQKTFWKLFYLGCTVLMCLCILFTFSRGAWVGLIVAVIIFSLYVDKRLLGMMAAAMAAILVLVPSITSRLTYLFTSDYAQASAIGGRTLRWEVGHNLLMENSPWLGFGLGRFGGAVAMNNQLLDQTEEFKYFYMDNYYLKTLVEMGFVGLIIFLLLLAVLAVYGLRAVYRSGLYYRGDKRADPFIRNIGNTKLLSAGIFSGLSGVLTHCYFENIFEEPYMMSYFWGLAAILIYLGFFQQRGRVSHSTQ
ncbi:MAG: hypothetical protein EOM59_04515 [Clostridia bacterium]|nr:hypothetical protein [Clostridia bacterium]